MILTPEIRDVLQHRSVRDKIAVARHQALCPPRVLPIVSMLVREGYLVWLDRAGLDIEGVLLDCDIYLLTPRGIALCEAHGIGQR